MPTYDYRCASCGTYEWVHGITEPALAVCPKCSGTSIERLFSPTKNIVVKTHKAKSDDEGMGGDEMAGAGMPGMEGMEGMGGMDEMGGMGGDDFGGGMGDLGGMNGDPGDGMDGEDIGGAGDEGGPGVDEG